MDIFSNFRPYSAGIFADDTLDKDKSIIRLSLSESSFGISNLAKIYLENEFRNISLYPDANYRLLRTVIAEKFNLSPEMVLVGNGLDELIFISSLAFQEKLGFGITTKNTYAGHMFSIIMAGGTCILADLDCYNVSPDAIHEEIINNKKDNRKISILYICNPHNPTGTILEEFQMDYLVHLTEKEKIVLVVDEAYAEFVTGKRYSSAVKYLKEKENIIILRTFSKAYGMAGIRCGFALGSKTLINKMMIVRNVLPFNVNRFAVAAAIGSLKDEDFIQEVKWKNNEIKKWFVNEMKKSNIGVIKSHTNFVLLKLNLNSQEFCSKLFDKYRIIVRDAAALGFPLHIRVSFTKKNTMQYVVSSIRDVLFSMQKERIE